jgi:hypothetical protein
MFSLRGAQHAHNTSSASVTTAKATSKGSKWCALQRAFSAPEFRGMNWSLVALVSSFSVS